MCELCGWAGLPCCFAAPVRFSFMLPSVTPEQGLVPFCTSFLSIVLGVCLGKLLVVRALHTHCKQ